MGLIPPIQAGSGNVRSRWLAAPGNLNSAYGQSQELRKAPKSFITLASDEEPPKSSYLAQATESPNLPRTAVKPVNTWRSPLRMELSRHSWQNLQEWVTEEVRLKHRAKWEGKYAIWEWELCCTPVKPAHWCFLRMKRSGEVREAHNKLTSYRCTQVGLFNLQDLSLSREGHRIS